jgi:hypothetical protein
MRWFVVLPFLVGCTDYGLTPFGDSNLPPGDEATDQGDGDEEWWNQPWGDPEDPTNEDFDEGDDPDDPDTPNIWDEDDDEDFDAARMTGGGEMVHNGSAYTHGFTLHCAFTHHVANLQLSWEGGHFHLDDVAWVVCLDDPALEPSQPAVGFDTVVGVGWGRLDGVDADIWFKLTDAGEPGDLDTLAFELAIGAWTMDGAGTLTDGNHQAHTTVH